MIRMMRACSLARPGFDKSSQLRSPNSPSIAVCRHRICTHTPCSKARRILPIRTCGDSTRWQDNCRSSPHPRRRSTALKVCSPRPAPRRRYRLDSATSSKRMQQTAGKRRSSAGTTLSTCRRLQPSLVASARNAFSIAVAGRARMLATISPTRTYCKRRHGLQYVALLGAIACGHNSGIAAAQCFVSCRCLPDIKADLERHTRFAALLHLLVLRS